MKLLILLSLFMYQCSGEVFSSVAEMKRIIGSSETVMELVQRYIELERQRLGLLQSYAQQFAVMYNQNSRYFKSDYLSHPTAAYLIANIIANYWTPIEKTMRENKADEVMKQAALPSSDDTVGLAKALMILQTTYQIEINDLADGKIHGQRSPVVMTARDCYDVGRVAYDARSYFHTVLWMQEALERYRREKPTASVNETDILEYLAYPLGELGNISGALELTKRLHTLVPNHPRAPGNIAYYESVLEKNAQWKQKFQANDSLAKWKRYGQYKYEYNEPYGYDHYAALCRGEVGQGDEELMRLYCYYKNDSPFLILAPIKVEILLREPEVLLFRRVISDKEIEQIISSSETTLIRSMVASVHGNGSEKSDSRISKNTWMADRAHPVAASLSRRVSQMTGLDMSTAEDFQVANYGIGGHYRPHIDMLHVDGYGQPDETKRKNASNGDRIATVLFYMSQPLAGGATVFSHLNLTLFPSKYDAVFWYNYKRNGRADMRTRHSGCPVMTGSKWILNKWIHERGQEFNRPCGLDANE